MINIILYFSIGLILLGYCYYIYLYITYNNTKITDDNGFLIIKDIISIYDKINVILGEGKFNIYNIKRKVIKLNNKTYYGNDLSNISLGLMEAGLSVIDNNKNKFMYYIKYLFNNLVLLYILPVLAIVISLLTYNYIDLNINIIIMVLLLIIMYMLIDVRTMSFMWIKDNIKKVKILSRKNIIDINDYINRLLISDKLIFIGELGLLLRFFVILIS